MPKRTYSSTRSNNARKIAASMLPAPCTICSRIVTDQHRWQADHIVPRVIAEAQGWDATQIDAASNIGPAHRSCNESSGARLGNYHRAKAKATPRTVPTVKRPQLGGADV